MVMMVVTMVTVEYFHDEYLGPGSRLRVGDTRIGYKSRLCMTSYDRGTGSTLIKQG